MRENNFPHGQRARGRQKAVEKAARTRVDGTLLIGSWTRFQIAWYAQVQTQMSIEFKLFLTVWGTFTVAIVGLFTVGIYTGHGLIPAILLR